MRTTRGRRAHGTIGLALWIGSAAGGLLGASCSDGAREAREEIRDEAGDAADQVQDAADEVQDEVDDHT